MLTYSSTNASSCSISSAPAVWTGSDPASVNCNGTYETTISPSPTERQWTFTFTASNGDGQSASSSQALTELAPPPKTTPSARVGQNPNWSGYVVPSSSSLFTETSASWTVPTLDCSATPDGGASIWVGIGGYGWSTGGTSGTLLQTGVATDCVGGVQQDHGWWEEYPSIPNEERAFAGFSVFPGDSIEGSVFQATDGAWETKVDDLTTGLSGVMVTGEGWGVLADTGDGTFTDQGQTIGLSYSGGYTAEWIVEDYTESDGSTMIPFVDYGTVDFTRLTTSLSAWTLTPSEGLAIVQNGVALSIPSPPTDGGFSVSYTG